MLLTLFSYTIISRVVYDVNILPSSVGLAMELMTRGAMLTVLSSLLTALAWPAALFTATDLIDSKWAIAIDRFAYFIS